MTSHLGVVLLYLLGGLIVSLLGILVVRYPQATYAIRTDWKHDDASLSSSGRTDQQLMGVVITLIGIGLLLKGIV